MSLYDVRLSAALVMERESEQVRRVCLATLARVKVLKRMHFFTRNQGAILAKDTANSCRANVRLAMEKAWC